MGHNEIRKLIEAVEFKFGKKIKVTDDFENLAADIKAKCEEYLSPLALKKLWGFFTNMEKPKPRTLDTLSLFLGFQDWDGFKSALHGESDGETNFESGKLVAEVDLEKGDKLQLRWKPDNLYVVRYEGDNLFTVMSSSNNEVLQVSDTFKCADCENGKPLIIKNVVHNDQILKFLVLGDADGIRFMLVNH
jgi:hypothetical protein